MIPRIIHYCWLSKDPYPADVKKYMDSWEKNLPNYKFVLWNFDRFSVESSIWVKEAFEKKKYAFAADYIRLFAVYNFGGFYLDSDVEILKSFDDLLDRRDLLCMQKDFDGLEMGVFGAEKNAPWLKICLDYYEGRHFVQDDGKLDLKPLPNIVEDVLKTGGYAFSFDEKIKREKTISLVSSDVLSPKSWKTGILEPTEITHSIHHFVASWVNKYDNLPLYGKLWKFLHLPDTDLRNKIRRLFNK